jgi:diguanylate cyclase (GGDEF)-like protein
MTAGLLRTGSVRALTVRYIVGLTLIGLLSIASYYIMEKLVVGEQASAAIINISGRQRMLSQKAVLLSQQLVISVDPLERAGLRSELRQVIESMREAQHALVHGDAAQGLPGGLSPAVQSLMFGQPVLLDGKLQHFFAAVTALMALSDSELTYDNPQLAVILSTVGGLLEAQDLLVAQFQRESEARIADIRAIEALVVYIMLAVLMLEALFIFQPAVLTLRRETNLLAEANAELERLSSVDSLTGLANRRSFDGFLEREWQRRAREKQELALIMADIDHFKNFNDSYGHQAGDECLRRVAAAIGDSVGRATDLAARYGGEEFAVVLPGTDVEGAELVAEKIRAAVAGLAIAHKASAAGEVVTISLGVAGAAAANCASPAQLIAAADRALYQAKQQGRNRVVVAKSDSGESGV